MSRSYLACCLVVAQLAQEEDVANIFAVVKAQEEDSAIFHAKFKLMLK